MSPGFRSHAGHFKPAEWMAPHECACDGAVDVKVSHLHFGFHAFDIGRAAREDSTGERILRVVGDGESMIEVIRAKDR